MGRYYSSDEEYESRKKKSKRRSRSSSRDADSRSNRKQKHKKSSSHSRRYRSRSKSKDGRRSHRRRSRSYSRDRHRSHSRGRYRSRERSRDYRYSSSRSRSGSLRRQRRSRSTSRGRRKGSPGYSASTSREHSSSRSCTEGFAKSFADMTPSEQNQARMQLAIEKAKAADEAIRQRHGVDDDEPADTKKRQQALQDIESDGFSQQTFSSSRSISNQNKKKESEFSFGTSLDFVKTSSSVLTDPDSLMHSRFTEDDNRRKERWNDKLQKLRIKFLAV